MAHLVLIVDDSLTVRMDLHHAFEAGGFHSVLCATGTEAREAFARERLDAAVLDILLPDADGVELLKELRAHPTQCDAVVILLSSEAEVTDRVHGLRTGADEYVGKPYDSGYVVARTRQLLRARCAPTQEATSVLLIDDNPAFRAELHRVLEAQRYEVVTAGSGEEGLRIAADRRPHAVIVDGVLPGIDGATVIRRIRLDAALRDTPCLLLTTDDDSTVERQVLDAGADALARKQDDVAVLLAKLTAILRGTTDALPIQPAGSMHGPTKVLAVESDRARLHTIGDVLRNDGYEVVLAHSANDALALLAAQPVGCVLLALDLPDLGGTRACERIKAAPSLREIPLIMMGDRDDGAALLDCLRAGAEAYVRKSEEPDALRAHVRAQIRRKQLQDESRRIREELLRGELEVAKARAARELAEARAAMVEELEWRNRELEAFSGSVSHDLRSPLQVIIGFADALLDGDAGCLDETARDHLTRIHRAGQRMNQLIESLLLLSRASRGELRRQPVDISALAREVAEELLARDPERAMTITVEDGMVSEGDVGLVRVVLVNLMANAWKFTTRTAQPQTEVGSLRRDGEPGYYVRDNGAGFPSEQAAQLFRPFGRLHSADEFPGTGIGLTTVHRIIERHGGKIWAEGEVGRGATFCFTLPAQPASPSGR